MTSPFITIANEPAPKARDALAQGNALGTGM